MKKFFVLTLILSVKIQNYFHDSFFKFSTPFVPRWRGKFFHLICPPLAGVGGGESLRRGKFAHLICPPLAGVGGGFSSIPQSYPE
jgi:hypothetical protein